MLQQDELLKYIKPNQMLVVLFFIRSKPTDSVFPLVKNSFERLALSAQLVLEDVPPAWFSSVSLAEFLFFRQGIRLLQQLKSNPQYKYTSRGHNDCSNAGSREKSEFSSVWLTKLYPQPGPMTRDTFVVFPALIENPILPICKGQYP